MNKEIRQCIKQLQRDGVVIAVEPTKKTHWRLTLRNGYVYIMAGTPSDWRCIRNMVAEIQRAVRLHKV